jgi:hypothetical protein
MIIMMVGTLIAELPFRSATASNPYSQKDLTIFCDHTHTTLYPQNNWQITAIME